MEITTIDTDKLEKGIFFRNFIQKREFDEYTGEAYNFYEKLKKNIILRLINKKVYCNFEKWSNDDNFTGITGRAFASPIYFSRIVRRARHIFTDHPCIKEIITFGEEPYMNQCSGNCIKEKAVIYFKDGYKKQTIKTKEKFHFYYNHVVKELFAGEKNAKRNRKR